MAAVRSGFPRVANSRTDAPQIARTKYEAGNADLSLRAFLSQANEASTKRSAVLVDVRSPQEFTGEILAPRSCRKRASAEDTYQAREIFPWGKACNEDGTFKSADELRQIYGAEGVDGSKPVIAYCRIGERSSHTWFVLNYLLGYAKVRNYDGSWTEWGNRVGANVERGEAANAAKG